jgi:S1-C subfamily serine protease
MATKDHRKWSHLLVMAGIALSTASCFSATEESVKPLSSSVLCDFLTPNYITLPSERRAIRGELAKRNVRCRGGQPIRYAARRRRRSRPHRRRIKRGTSYGTGIVINRAGDVLTNHHVVDDCGSITVDLHGTLFHGTKTADDPTNDLAVVHAKGLTAKTYARFRTQKIRLAENVLVLGYPLQPILGHGLKAPTGNSPPRSSRETAAGRCWTEVDS